MKLEGQARPGLGVSGKIQRETIGNTESSSQDHLVFPSPSLAQLPDIFTIDTARILQTSVSALLSHILAVPPP